MAEKRDRIENLRKRLYSKTRESAPRERRPLRDTDGEVPEAWEHPEAENAQDDMAGKKQKRSTLSAFLIASIGFFVVALGLSAYFFLAGSNTISAKNVDIRIDGPTTTDGGEVLSLQITVVNRNDVAMQLADLIVEYPEGTRSATDLNTELPRHRETLGTIEPGGQVKRTVQAILFGEEDTEQRITATVEYRVESSNAIFFKESEFETLISSSPLSLSVDALNETTSGQEIELAVTVRSNSSAVLEDVLLRAEYPFGFAYDSATPEAAFSSNVWELGDIQPEGERVIRIRGSLTGQENEERIFRFASGIQSETDNNQLAAAFITANHTVNVKRPFLAAEIAIAGERAGTHVTAGGEPVRVDVTLSNTLPSRIFDAEARLRLTGSALDRSSVSVTKGFYQSANNTVVWNRNTDNNLGELPAGESVTLSFVFKSLAGSSLAALTNPEIDLNLSVSGRRLSESGTPEVIDTTSSRIVQVLTDLRLVSRGLYFSGPFQNSGPLPPEVERETTYTVVWTATNAINDVADATVSASLPPYVRWLGATSPANENISFNPVGGRVVWNIGDLDAGAGHDKPAREVAFQIEFVPSVSQVEQEPVLVGQQRIQGKDTFTGRDVSSTRGPITTNLSGDPQFQSGQGRVVE